jgi:hypothetical protein
VVVALVVAVEAAAAAISKSSSWIARSEFAGVSSLLNRLLGLTLAGGFLLDREPGRGRSCQGNHPLEPIALDRAGPRGKRQAGPNDGFS